MADISVLSRLIAGAQRNVDLSANALVVGSLKVGSVSPTELTKAILDNLINLQNGTDFATGTNAHTHDGRYFTETELGSATSTTGSDLIGDDATYTNFTPAAATVKGALSGIDSALGAISITPDFSDLVFRIHDNGDATKKIAFEASAITTGTVRTITMPDANVNLADVNNAILKDGSRTFTANQPMGGFKLTGLAAGSTAGDSVRYEQAIRADGTNAFTGNQSMGSNKLTNVADPTTAQDAATKAYVDAVAQGLRPKQAVRAGSLANVNLASGPSTLDGVTLVSGNRVLIKNQTLPQDNGIYIWNGAAAALTRAPDMDSLSPIDEINGAYTFIQEGTQSGQGWVEQGTVAVLGTDPMNWVYFNDAAAVIGGDMITVVGQTISVDLATVSGLESSNPGNAAGQLRIKLEASNPSLKFSGSNELGVKLDGAGALLSGASGVSVQVDNSSIEINTNALRIKALGVVLGMLAANSVDENKIVSTTFSASGAIVGGGATKAAVQVDGVGIEINTNALRLKDAGVTAAKLNTNVADQSTITGGGGTALSVAAAPLMQRTMVAGEAFAADTSFLVRLALTGETAGRVYKADKDASATQKWAAIGLARSVAGVSAGGNINVVMLGEAALGANDTSFGAGDVGKELFVGTAGAFILGSSLANTTNEAQFCAGVIQTTTKIWVDFKQLRGIY